MAETGRSGSFTFTDGWGSAKLSWSETYNIASNTSDVKFTLQFQISSMAGYPGLTYYNNGSLTAGGSILYSSLGTNAVFLASRYNWYTPTPDSSWTRSGIAHNADGTGTLSVTLDSTLEVPNPNPAFTKPHINETRTITLTTIPRASTATCTGGTIGQPATITINSASGTFTHTLRFRFPGEGSNRNVYDTNGIEQRQISATSVQWQLDASQITDAYTAVGSTAKKVTATVYCYTYDSGGASVGNTTSTCELTIDEATSKPTGTQTLTISNPHTTLTGSSSTVILNADTVLAQMNTLSAHNGASITSVRFVNGAQQSVVSSAPYVAQFTEPTNAAFKWFATDTRGLTAQGHTTATVVNYQYPAPTIQGGVIAADTGNVTVKAKGSWWHGNFGAQNNAITVTLQYRQVGGSWSNITGASTTTSGGTFTTTGSLTGLDVSKDWQVRARVRDSLQAADSVYGYSAVVNLISVPVFDWGKRDFKVNGVFRMAGGAQWEGTTAQAASLLTQLKCPQYLSVTAVTVASQRYSDVTDITGLTTSSRALVQRRYSGTGNPSTYPILCGVPSDGTLRIYWNTAPSSGGTSIECDVIVVY